ncbi:MAG: adenylate/guanylate cyclase domain-containing protein [Candidatus Limnocylindria bacterium]
MRRDLPSGTVTLLFTDVEGSKLLEELGSERYDEALAEHRRIIRDGSTRHGGVEVDTQGDAFFVAFLWAADAVAAAAHVRDRLAEGPIRVRMGLHTGTPRVSSEGYIGPDVHKAARITAAGHGGQVLLSSETRELADAQVTDLGEHRLKDFKTAVPIFQLGSERFPLLKTISNTNVPRPASSFVGRQREVDEVRGLDDGRVEEALALLSECHRIHTEHGDRVQTAINVCRVTRALAVAGRVETAAVVLASGEAARETMGARVAWVDEMNEATLKAIEAQLDPPSLSEAWERGRKLTPDQAPALAGPCK